MTRTGTTKPAKPEQPEADAEAPEKDDVETPEPATPETDPSGGDKAEVDKTEPAEVEAKDDQAKEEDAETEAEDEDAQAGKEDAKAEAEKKDSTKTGDAAKKEDSAGEPDAKGGEEKPRERSWVRMPDKNGLVKATVAVALVGSVITAGLQWYQADQAAKRDAERREVRASAAAFGEALLSYDHTKLQDARNRVLGLASDDFAKTYDEAFTGGLEGVITKLKANATATVRTVYLGEIESGTAKAVVVMDSEVKSTAGTRRVLGSYLDMRLTRSGDDWKITEVTSVGAANESMTDPKGEQKKPEAGLPSPAPSP